MLMQMIKIIILFAIFILSNFIGRTISLKYKYRLEELKEMKSMLNIFKTKIKFTYETIPEIFDEISKKTNSNIGKIFFNAKEYMEKGNTADDSWKMSIKETKNNLNEEDKNTLNIMSKMLGESDVEGQVSQIDITLNFLEEQIEEAMQEKNKNERLYKKLGTIMGLGLVIILV